MRVLILCHGNVNRSALGAAVLRDYSQLEVRGGGLSHYAEKKSRARKRMREIAQGWGWTLEEHRSRRCTEDDAEWAEWVLLFDNGNERRFTEQFPEHVHKVVRVGRYATPAVDTIKDPGFLRNDDPQFEAIAKQVVHGCRGWATENIK